METDLKRRKALIFATGALTGAGLIAVSLPFIRSLEPASDKEHPVIDIDITKLKDGQMFAVELYGKLIYVIKRSEELINNLESINTKLLDPESNNSNQPEHSKNPLRSLRPDIFVAYASCTHLGCSVSHNPPGENADYGESFKMGNWYCPCHGSIYDLAGRVYKGVPAPRNLDIPEYEYYNDTTLRVKADIF